MPTIPWTATAAASGSAGPVPDEVLILGSRLVLRRAWDIPRFFAAAQSIRRQVLAADGCLGMSLRGEPFVKTFWTLSAWRDQAALDAFVGAQPHERIMRDFHPRLRDPVIISWTVPRGDLPVDWSDAVNRIAGHTSR
ncbi:putative quinol monooxygenase [Streptomyces sp. NPDC002402]